MPEGKIAMQEGREIPGIRRNGRITRDMPRRRRADRAEIHAIFHLVPFGRQQFAVNGIEARNPTLARLTRFRGIAREQATNDRQRISRNGQIHPPDAANFIRIRPDLHHG